VVRTARDDLLSPQEAGDRLGVSVYTVRRWIQEGRIPAYKPGKEYRIRDSDLEEFLQTREVRPKGRASSPLEPTLNGLLEEERRKDVYLPWLEFAGRYADRWHEKAKRGGLDRGAYYEWKETLHDLSATTKRLREEEEQGLSPEQRRELEDDLIMWKVQSRLIGTLPSVLGAMEKLYSESELEQFKRERAELEEWSRAASG
jgi:excisionase family DNA binding protein